MTVIEEIGIDRSKLVFDLVTKLLEELHDEPRKATPLNIEKIKQEWIANEDRFTAFAALETEDSAIGIITLIESFAFYTDGAYGIINELYVPPEHRNQKIGKMLLETAKEYGRQCGWKRIDVTAPLGEKWERTQAFYEREGFIATGPKLRFRI